jgi:hypothetical protein
MDDLELNRIVDAWIAGEDVEHGAPEHQRNWWAISQVMDWSLEGEAELLWRFILLTYERNISDRVVAVLAAGPLEDLLSKHGPLYIDRVEQLAQADERFNHLLGGVWRLSMTDDVWKRVQAVRKEIW